MQQHAAAERGREHGAWAMQAGVGHDGSADDPRSAVAWRVEHVGGFAFKYYRRQQVEEPTHEAGGTESGVRAATLRGL